MYTFSTKSKTMRIISVVMAIIMALSVYTGVSLSSTAVHAADGDVQITRQPSNTVVSQDKNATLAVTATTAAVGATLTYQWYETEDPVCRDSDSIQDIGNNAEFIPPASTGTAIAGETSRLFKPPTDTSGVKSYFVVVSDGSDTETSVAATVAVKSTAPKTDLKEPVKIIFICGGNTGRSPMARAIAEKVFAEKGIEAIFEDAGSDPNVDEAAEPNAVTLMAERGFDLSDHKAKRWTPEMLEEADYIFVMSGSHVNRVNVATLNIYSDKVFLFREFIGEGSVSVPDPWGEEMPAYIEAADIITNCVNKLADIIADELGKNEEMPFTDVAVGSWYYNAVNYVYKNSLMNGLSDTKFGPGESMLRSMFVTVIGRMDGNADGNAATPFTDVKQNSYFANHVKWANDNDIVNGISATRFGPNNKITRQEVAAIIVRYAEYKGITLTTAGADGFTDLNKAGAWARDSILKAQAAGIMTGTKDGKFEPTRSITRAEAAQMLMNFCENVL